jgi:hypothetical protein
VELLNHDVKANAAGGGVPRSAVSFALELHGYPRRRQRQAQVPLRFDHEVLPPAHAGIDSRP